LASGMPKEAYEEGKPWVNHLKGEVARRKISLTNDSVQAGERYHSLSKVDREHLIGNLIADLMHIDKPIQKRVIDNLNKADAELGRNVAKGLKLYKR
jgi:catalase